MNKNKKGDEKLLSIWWFFVLMVIGGGIVIGVMIFNSNEVNTNELEADILTERIVDCLDNNGYLNENLLNEDFNIFEECGLNEKVFRTGSNFYFSILIYDENENEIKEIISGGDHSFDKNCKIQGNINAPNFPRCSSKSEKVLKEGKNLKLIVLAGSNQKGETKSVVEN